MSPRPDAAVLALDQGTTGSTALVFGPEGEVLGRAYAEITQHYPSPGWVEHDAEEIWQKSRRVAAEAVAASGVAPGALRAIGITNQRETTVLWDRKTGDPVYRAIVWQSRQTADICARLKAEGHEPVFHERTGLVLDPYFSGQQDRLAPRGRPRPPGPRRERARSRSARSTPGSSTASPAAASTPPTPRTPRARSSSTSTRAAGTPSSCGSSACPPRCCPRCARAPASSGRRWPSTASPPGIPIAGDAGDQQAALFGQGCFEPGMAKNTYGTGAFLVLNTGDRRVISRRGLLTTLCCDARGRAAYALEGSVFVAGAAVQWLRDEMGLVRTAAETGPIAESVPDTHGVYVVPAFTGLGAPYWDAGARGAILGLTRGAGRAHLVRATLESLAYQSRDVIDAMNEESGVPLRELRVDGGACANDFLMQFQADILGVPVDRPALVETTAAGRGLPGRPRRRPLEGRGVARRPPAAGSPLHAVDAAGAARGASTPAGRPPSSACAAAGRPPQPRR